MRDCGEERTRARAGVIKLTLAKFGYRPENPGKLLVVAAGDGVMRRTDGIFRVYIRARFVNFVAAAAAACMER